MSEFCALFLGQKLLWRCLRVWTSLGRLSHEPSAWYHMRLSQEPRVWTSLDYQHGSGCVEIFFLPWISAIRRRMQRPSRSRPGDNGARRGTLEWAEEKILLQKLEPPVLGNNMFKFFPFTSTFSQDPYTSLTAVP